MGLIRQRDITLRYLKHAAGTKPSRLGDLELDVSLLAEELLARYRAAWRNDSSQLAGRWSKSLEEPISIDLASLKKSVENALRDLVGDDDFTLTVTSHPISGRLPYISEVEVVFTLTQ